MKPKPLHDDILIAKHNPLELAIQGQEVELELICEKGIRDKDQAVTKEIVGDAVKETLPINRNLGSFRKPADLLPRLLHQNDTTEDEKTTD